MIADDPIPCVVALDGGTSTTRARLLVEGQVVATARRAVGARDTLLGAGRDALSEAVRATIEEVCAGGIEPDAIVACGMLTSDVGLEAVPHVATPAGLDELARGVVARSRPELARGPILFVPGVRTPAAPGPDGWADADVMRGEECETLGAWLTLAARGESDGPTAFVWPGSHAKLVAVDTSGRIVGSHTTLAGELTETLAHRTILASSLPESFPENPDRAAFDSGARLVAASGLGRAAFLVRIAALSGTFDAPGRASFWIGAVIGDDAACLARHPILARGGPLWVGGRQPQRSLYASELARRHPGTVRTLSDEDADAASARGALAIAGRYLARRN